MSCRRIRLSMIISLALLCMISLTTTSGSDQVDNLGSLSVGSLLVLSKLRGLQSEVSNIFSSIDDEKQKEMIEELMNSEEQASEVRADKQIYSNNMDSLTEASRQFLTRLREIDSEKQLLIEGIKEENEKRKVVLVNLSDELESLRKEVIKIV